MTENLAAQVQQHLYDHGMDGRFERLSPDLGVARATAPYAFEAMVYEPTVCLILQGAKLATLGSRVVPLHAGQFLVVSHDLPVLARVQEASVETPYLGLVARLDIGELRSLDQQLGLPGAHDDARSLDADRADAALLSVFSRMVQAATDPVDVSVLGPMLRRELHYRLLRNRRGGMLRKLLHRDSHASHIQRAIALIRDGYRGRIAMDAVARQVGMSPSSFYKHFKTVTETTPLQYQKNLRLTEAQRLLREGTHTVSTAAFAVGYESASQFSREYSRRFGAPPRGELRT
jgi:AraC-like DNA-binding protein